MSVDLVIDWPNAKSEVVPLSSYRGMSEYWKPVAEELGLELMPHFSSFLPIYRENLDQVLNEVQVFRDEVVRRGPDYEEWLAAVDRLIEALQRLKHSEGWEASIG